MTTPRKRPVNRKVYDQNHYRAKAMLRDPWFVAKATWLRRRFAETGCPIPKLPFKTYKAYLAWNGRFWDRYGEMESSPEFRAAKHRITEGKETFPMEVWRELEDFRTEFLPPVYGEVYDEILEHFNIDRKDRGFRDFLERHFFFGGTEYPTPYLTTVMRRNEKTREWELFVRIFGYTKKEDIVRNWPRIAEQQRRLSDFLDRSREWTTFERDLEIYTRYKELRAVGPRREQPADREIYVELHRFYREITVTSIRNIVSRTKKRLGEI